MIYLHLIVEPQYLSVVQDDSATSKTYAWGCFSESLNVLTLLKGLLIKDSAPAHVSFGNRFLAEWSLATRMHLQRQKGA